MAHFRRLSEDSSEAFRLHNGEHFTYCNEAAASLLGLRNRAMIHGRTLAEPSPNRQPNGHHGPRRSERLSDGQLFVAA